MRPIFLLFVLLAACGGKSDDTQGNTSCECECACDDGSTVSDVTCGSDGCCDATCDAECGATSGSASAEVCITVG